MIVDMAYWTRVGKRIIYLVLSLILVVAIFKISIFYLPFLIAFIIYLLIEPAIKFLMNKFNIHRKTSSILIFIIVFAVIAGLLAWGIATLISEGTNLLQGLNDYIDKLYGIVEDISNSSGIKKISVPPQVKSVFENSINEFIANLSVWLRNILTNFLNLISQVPTIAIYFVISVLALYFLCVDKIYILDQVEHHLPRAWVKKVIIHIREISKSLGCYLKAEGILVLVSFVISVFGLYFLKIIGFDIKYPLTIALGIGIVDALPILGSGTVMIPWAIISGINGDIKLGIAIVILWIIMTVVRQIIEPKVVSNQIGIHPIFTLTAMYTGFKILGIIGMFIGPIILIILKNIYSATLDKGVAKAIFERN